MDFHLQQLYLNYLYGHTLSELICWANPAGSPTWVPPSWLSVGESAWSDAGQTAPLQVTTGQGMEPCGSARKKVSHRDLPELDRSMPDLHSRLMSFCYKGISDLIFSSGFLPKSHTPAQDWLLHIDLGGTLGRQIAAPCDNVHFYAKYILVWCADFLATRQQN